MKHYPETPVDVSERETLRELRIRRGFSILFGGMFVFEILNYLHILSFPVDFTWLGRCMSTLIVFGVLRLIDEVFKRKLGTRLQGKVWILMAVVLGVDFVGDVFGLYGRFDSYDQIAHFSSGLLLMTSLILALDTVASRRGWRYPRALTYLLALGMNTIFAVGYEIEEYLEDYFFHSHRLGDGPDTANDLMLNLLGGIVIILIQIGYRRRSYFFYDYQDQSK